MMSSEVDSILACQRRAWRRLARASHSSFNQARLMDVGGLARTQSKLLSDEYHEFVPLATVKSRAGSTSIACFEQDLLRKGTASVNGSVDSCAFGYIIL